MNKMDTPTIVALVHNLVQIVTWLFVFMALLPPDRNPLWIGTWLSIGSWPMDQYWDQSSSFKTMLDLAQGL